MDNTDRYLNMVRKSYSNHQAIAQYTHRVENGLRNCEQEIISRHFPPQGHLLVIGCGAGREAFALETLGYQVTATDISQALINKAQPKQWTMIFYPIPSSAKNAFISTTNRGGSTS